jgi:hypothetical protein
MKQSKTLVFTTVGLLLMLATAGLSPRAAALVMPQSVPDDTISGTITATKIITRNTSLTGDVTCAVSGPAAAGACIQFGASGITLNLHGFTITGLADPSTGCPDGVTNQTGILATGTGLSDLTVQGPGLVQQFRGHGIAINNTARAKVVAVTSSTNCFAGIILSGSTTDALIEDNVLVKNGNLTAACGGL